MDQTVKFERVDDATLEEIARHASKAKDDGNFLSTFNHLLGYASSVSQFHHYVAAIAIELQQYRASNKKPSCEVEGGIENTQPVKCPRGCPDGVLKTECTNIDNTSTFLVCSSCACCYHADNIK